MSILMNDDYGCLYYYDCITQDKYIIQKNTNNN